MVDEVVGQGEGAGGEFCANQVLAEQKGASFIAIVVRMYAGKGVAEQVSERIVEHFDAARRKDEGVPVDELDAVIVEEEGLWLLQRKRFILDHADRVVADGSVAGADVEGVVSYRLDRVVLEA